MEYRAMRGRQTVACFSPFQLTILFLFLSSRVSCILCIAFDRVHQNRFRYPHARSLDSPYNAVVTVEHDYEDVGPVLVQCCSSIQECVVPPGMGALKYGDVFTFFPDYDDDVGWDCHVIQPRLKLTREKSGKFPNVPTLEYRGLTTNVWGEDEDLLDCDRSLQGRTICDYWITSTGLAMSMYHHGEDSGQSELEYWGAYVIEHWFVTPCRFWNDASLSVYKSLNNMKSFGMFYWSLFYACP